MHLLPRQVGSKTAMAMLLAGKQLAAAEALALGLINDVTPPGGALDAARALAQRVLKGSPKAIATCLDIARRSATVPDVQEALRGRYDSLDALRRSADFIDGPKSFAERRAPSWITEGKA
jgi:enoyl-CoA hydratase/carnithine racemase